jgi:hypothetical protein
MSHKLDKKRHKQTVKTKLRRLKKRYMTITKGDTLAPDKALAVLKDSDELERVKRMARRLGLRGIQVRLAPTT